MGRKFRLATTEGIGVTNVAGSRGSALAERNLNWRLATGNMRQAAPRHVA